MADLYTPADDLLQRVAANRSAETAAARATLAGPVPPPPVPPTATTLAAPTAAQPVNKLAYGAGRAVGVIGNLASKAAVATPLAGFGDYQANTGGVDTSAGGTLGYLAKGELGNVGASLSGGAAEALADSGRGVAKTIDGIAGYVGAKPGLTQGYDNFISKNMGGYLSLKPQDAAPAGPIAAAATKANPVQERVAGVIQKMSGGADVQSNAAPAAAPARNPAYDRQPSLVVPSTADADRQFLAGAFQRHVNSGDLERARATAVSPEDMAQLGAAEGAQVAARDAAYRAAPLERQIQDLLNRSPRERALDEDPRTRAFSGVSGGRRGAQPAANTGGQEQAQGLIQMLAAQKGSGIPFTPQEAAQNALATINNDKASKTNIEGHKIAQDGAKITQQGLLQTQALQKQLLTEKDPDKRAQIIENIQTLTGKYEKAAPAAKAVIEDYDTGQKDMMGQPIFKKRAINPETGEPITKPAAAAKPTKAQLDAFAKDAIARGANPEAVKKRVAEMAGA